MQIYLNSRLFPFRFLADTEASRESLLFDSEDEIKYEPWCEFAIIYRETKEKEKWYDFIRRINLAWLC